MTQKTAREDPYLRAAGLFLPAGTSALLLSIAHFEPILWFISLFALVPYLWKLRRTDFKGSVILGVILAACFAGVVLIDNLPAAPHQFFIKLLVLVSIFSFFGIIVNKTKEYIGFYPVFIAAIWIPLEYFLIRFADIGDVLNFPSAGSSLLNRFGSLFGLLLVSFTIMLINSVILLLIERGKLNFRFSARLDYAFFGKIKYEKADIKLPRSRYYSIDCRAPPSSCKPAYF